MNTLSMALLALVSIPISLVVGAYLARWIAGFFFTKRESEIVAIAAVMGGFGGMQIYGIKSGLVFVCGLMGWTIGLAILHILWRKAEVKHAQ